MIESRKSSSIEFALYSDSQLNAASAMGIAFQLDEATRTRYLGFGIDLEEVSGEGHGQLPVPSVFLVSAGGEILWVYSNPDYKIRPENDALLKAARKSTRKAQAQNQ